MKLDGPSTDLSPATDLGRSAARALRLALSAGALAVSLGATSASAQVSGYELKMPASAKAGQLTAFRPCTFKGLSSRGSDVAECATLVVPENPAKPGGRLLPLPVVKLPALKATSLEPIFWLHGGPGGSNISFGVDGRTVFEEHDVYMLGYRGVDDPNPMQCPEIARASVGRQPLGEKTAAQITDAAAQCAARITASGADLSHYNIVDVIDDQERLRGALSVPQVDLIGESYGTRLAQFYSRLHPGSVRRSIQFSVLSPGHFHWDPATTNELLRGYSKLCAADVACSRRTPDLYKSVVGTLARNDLAFKGAPVDMDKVRIAAQLMLLSKENAVVLFDALLSAEKGDASGVAQIPPQFDMLVPSGFVWGDLINKAWGAASPKDVRKFAEERLSSPTSFGSPLDLFFWSAFRGWPDQMLPAGFNKAIQDGTPTLLVSGNIDITTPTKFVRAELLPYLPNGHLVVLSNLAHDDWETEQLPSLDRLVSSYLRDGTVDASGYVTSRVPFR